MSTRPMCCQLQRIWWQSLDHCMNRSPARCELRGLSLQQLYDLLACTVQCMLHDVLHKAALDLACLVRSCVSFVHTIARQVLPHRQHYGAETHPALVSVQPLDRRELSRPDGPVPGH